MHKRQLDAGYYVLTVMLQFSISLLLHITTRQDKFSSELCLIDCT